MTSQVQFSHEHFDYIRSYLYDVAGITLADRKKQMVENRINKRIKELSLSGFDQYVSRLRNDSTQEEMVNLVNALTTNVTHFFRENHHFDHFRGYMAGLLQARDGRRIRVWSAACSIGAEPYSMAMVLYDVMQELKLRADARILATDIDTLALARARMGAYHDKTLKGMTPSVLKKHFMLSEEDGEDVYTIKPYLRQMVAYNYLNFNTASWPMSRQFDAIFCRNVLIYFDRAKQQEYIGKMLSYLKPGGFLYLGHSEHAVMENKGYKVCGQTIYQKSD